MLDPFSALSLAAAIIQFVDFSSKIVLGATELYRSTTGSLTKNVELSTIVADLGEISSNLRVYDRESHLYSKDERALSNLAIQCKGSAEALLIALDDLSIKEPHKRWKSVRQALRSVWKENEIRDLQKRLDSFRSQLTIRLVATLRYNSSRIVHSSFLCSLSKADYIMRIAISSQL
jgi:hypothetical protein